MYTFNNQKYDSAKIHLPHLGVWSATLVYTGLNAPPVGTKSELTFGENSFVGTVISANILNETNVKIEVVGGNGNMGQFPKAKHFKNKTAGTVINELLNGKETGDTIPQEISGFNLNHYQFYDTIPVGQQLTKLLTRFDYLWNINSAGNIQFHKYTSDYTFPKGLKLFEKTAEGNLIYQALELNKLDDVGKLYKNKEIEEIEVFIEKTKTEVHFNLYSMRNKLRDILNTDFARVKANIFECEIVGQNSDGPGGQVGGTLNVRPLDPTIRGRGLDSVPIVVPQGLLLQVSTDSNCFLKFIDNDFNKPKIISFSDLENSGSEFVWVLGNNSGAQWLALSNIVNDNLQKIVDDFNAHVHNSAVGVVSTPITPMTTLPDTACDRIKST